MTPPHTRLSWWFLFHIAILLGNTGPPSGTAQATLAALQAFRYQAEPVEVHYRAITILPAWDIRSPSNRLTSPPSSCVLVPRLEERGESDCIGYPATAANNESHKEDKW